MKIKKSDQIVYLDKYLSKCLDSFIAYIDSRDHTDLHVMRVSIKKYRALAELMFPLIGAEKKLNKLKPIKKLFKKAGIIRSDYLLQVQLNKFGISAKDELYLSLKENEEINSRLLCFEAENLVAEIIKTHTSLTKTVKSISFSHLERFVSDYLVNIEKHLKSEFDWHESRKHIKRVLYLKDMLNDDIKIKLNLNFTYLDTLQDLIGKWNDMKELDSFVSQTFERKAEVKNDTSKKIERLQKQIRKLIIPFSTNLQSTNVE